ncbi:MAG: hypothetical protein QOD33_28 [Pyrinomonadaceae bacterium]|jgi:hypothetical protein|nr:hypothetical protein [Pyrinomonadaceae bacterium]
MNTVTRKSELGSARLKFLVVVAIIAIGVYCGYQFIPVAYDAYQFRDLMQHDVDAAVAMGKPASWVQDQLIKSAPEYGVPNDLTINASQQDNRVEVRVQYTQAIEFPLYVYNYEFDHTAKSATFLSVK